MEVKYLKRKRFKKLMMSHGFSRNEINVFIERLRLQTQINQRSPYQEIRKLMRMLSDYDIPYSAYDMFDGIQVSYPGDETVVCSVIEHGFSYGNQVDRLEIMGLLTKEELEHDSVKGWMTAQMVFARIYKHYKGDESHGTH